MKMSLSYKFHHLRKLILFLHYKNLFKQKIMSFMKFKSLLDYQDTHLKKKN